MNWHINVNNQNVGPLSEEDVRARLKTGQISPNTPVWREGLPQWVPLGSSELMARIGAAPVPPQAPGGYPPPPGTFAGQQVVHAVFPTSDPMAFMSDLSDQEKLMFQNEFNSARKDGTTAVLLAFFLGGIGGHKFYMGSTGLGVLYLLFCWTGIPQFVALIECFLLSGQVRTHNATKAQEIAMRIKAYRSGAVLRAA